MTPKRIRLLRRSLDLTQEAFGKICGVCGMTVWKWEKGQAMPRGPARMILENYESQVNVQITNAEIQKRQNDR